MKQGKKAKPCTSRHERTSVISRIRSWSHQGRVVLRGDTVKDDSGSYAVFTEEGSSASQMTAAKVMDVIARLPGCAGQAADEISAYTQVKMEDAPSVVFCPLAPCSSVSLAVSPQRRAFVSVSSRFQVKMEDAST